ncbi:MAG: N-acetylmuramoyl-L-alanine amidase [candidate division Zixibacteria bacterium]|nr:N-acetylmuramoyl-L-alanine amidase [candidate division Zixibacteria bacterium]
MKIHFTLIILIFFIRISAAEINNPPMIKVVYPNEGREITSSDSTFIFGSVTPGSDLKINGQNVKVYKNGAYLAYLPLKPGDFVFELIASNQNGISTKKVTVKVPFPLRATPEDTLHIESSGKAPSFDLVLNPGDIIQTSFKGTPNCSAFFYIQGLTSPLPMIEPYKSNPVFWGEGVFGKWETEDSILQDGIYTGLYKIKPSDKIENGKIVFEIFKIIENPDSFYSPAEAFYDKEKGLVCLVDSAPGKITIKEEEIPQIVELRDSSSIIRTGPGLGYLLLYQPQGIRFVVSGRNGNWVRLNLADNIEGWVKEEALNFLPAGIPVPESNIKFIRSETLGDRTRIKISLSQKLPYEVQQEISPPVLILKIYGGNSDTDWIRYDLKDEIIQQIKWEQIQNKVFQLKVYLKQRRFWGYDIYYKDNELCLELRKEPEVKLKLKGLKVCIDPGHSPESGAVGPTGLEERVVNLEIVLKLKKILEINGAEVILTRYGMEGVGIYERPKKAVDNNCHILISIHNNALPDGVNPFLNNGVSTYYYHPQSLELARAIQKELAKKLQIPDQGLYYANFALTRPYQFLSVLVECAFIIYPEQEELLRNEVFQKKCALSIYQGILNYIKGD